MDRRTQESLKMFVLVDCNLGNLRNVQKAFEKIGEKAIISSNVNDIKKAKGLILPGVGAFPEAMRNIHSLGLFDVLRDQVLNKKKPILGICLGMQLFGREGYENERCEGLNFLPMVIKKLEVNINEYRLPHIGWNNITVKKSLPLFESLPDDPDFYFVHSYHPICEDNNIISATCNYGQTFVVAVQNKNIFGVQFHPEKSQEYGLKILKNFVKYVKSGG